MYFMKNVIDHDSKITLSKCMYHMKSIYDSDTQRESHEEININVRKQVIKFLKMPGAEMTDLEVRQDLLLKKLDLLYDRIKTISSFCRVESTTDGPISKKVPLITIQEEIVLVYGPDYLPWFLKKIIKESAHQVNISWHIHSTVPSEKVPKVKAFVKTFPNSDNNSRVNLRLIFKNVSADPELKLSSLEVPIIGNVNILRFLSLAYPSVIPYNYEDYNMDHLLDICHVLERSSEKNKDAVTKKIFSQSKKWIYKNEFSIIDAAVFHILKQWQNSAKYAPKEWFAACEKLF